MDKTDIIELNSAISSLFEKLGFKTEHTGYKYAIDFVKECFGGIPPSMIDWYECEAKKYGKKSSTIERSIRQACRDAIGENCDMLFDVFDEQTRNKQTFASNRNFLTSLYRYLKNNAAKLGLTELVETESR